MAEIAIVTGRAALSDGDIAAIGRYAEVRRGTIQALIDSAFSEGLEILLERIEEAEMQAAAEVD